MSRIFVETERLFLRRLEEADFADYAAYAVDDEMSQMMGRAFLHTEADIRQNFDWLKDKEPRCYGIFEKASGRLIGNLNISAVPGFLASLEPLAGKQGQTLSFCIRRESQRRGYAAEALRAVIDELFRVEQMDFAQCGCYAFNEPSRRLQEALGFAFLTRSRVPTPEGEQETLEHILWNSYQKGRSMKHIDPAQWSRAEKFQFFSAVSQPFYSVTFRVDVTNLHAYTKRHGLSFYYALVYLATNAVNVVENFRYTMRNGEIFLLDERIPSFTDLKPGSDDFYIVTLPQEQTMEQFCAAAKARSNAQAHFLDQDDKELDALIYFSCTPWFDLTSLTNERDFDRDDNIPRIVWGRYVPDHGRETLGMAVEVNHRFIDGVHLGRFYQTLQASIDALEP